MERGNARSPFDEAALANSYEEWYSAEGCRADTLEKALLARLLGAFPDAHSVLEVGCGTGHFTRWLSDRGLDAVGLDRSEAMLVQARRLDGAKYLRGDAHSLPVSDRSYDLVALLTALEFLEDPGRALSEAVRVARRGLLLGVLNRWSVLGARYRLSGGTIWKSARFFGPLELARLVRASMGRRAGSIALRTTLWPLPCLNDLPLPWGGFIGMAVQLDEEPEG
jgi:SAM-dependent methyltransferase